MTKQNLYDGIWLHKTNYTKIYPIYVAKMSIKYQSSILRGGFQLFRYSVGALSGLAAGFLFNRLAAFQITKRTNDPVKKETVKKTWLVLVWALISSGLFVAVVLKQPDLLRRIEYCVYISLALNISVVDWLIRKIPNGLLLALMLTKLIFTVYDIIGEGTLRVAWKPPVVGLAVGLGLFIIPSFFGIMIGAGDVKFAGVIGFCLGFSGFIQSMVIMAAALMVYLIYLIVTHKGNLKTPAAMGPFLSLGAIVTLLLPLKLFDFSFI